MLVKLNSISNMDKNSKILLLIIAIISALLLIIFIINFISSRKEMRLQRIRKKSKRALEKELELESKNIIPVKTAEVKTSPISSVSVKEDIESLPLEEEIIEVLEEDNDVDKIINEIKNSSNNEILDLTEFEKEQEETAIISYDELCRKAGVKKKVYKTVSEVVNKEKETYNVNFKPTKFVSPIFGVQEEKIETPNDIDQTFLKKLKEFRSGLE